MKKREKDVKLFLSKNNPLRSIFDWLVGHIAQLQKTLPFAKKISNCSSSFHFISFGLEKKI